MLTVAYLANRFPRWGGGWVLNEVRGLREAGIDLKVFSFRPPHDDVVRQQGMRQWMETTSYVPRGSSLACLAAAARWLLRSPAGFIRGLRTAFRLSGRMSHGSHILEIFWLASRIRLSGAEHIHAQHADYVGDEAMAVAAVLNLPFSLTAHANDLYTNPGRLKEKIGAARFISTCTAYNEKYLRTLCDEPSKVVRVYHGVDLVRFSPRLHGEAPSPRRLITVTRLKEKKGFPWLLTALGMLRDRGVEFTLDVYGDGDRREEIETRIRELKLEERVRLMGSIEHEKIPAALSRSGIFVLACVVLANKDRDGIPNTIIEALACGVPVISTAVSGIPEAVRDGEGGLLVPECDAAALAAAIGTMMSDEELRKRCAVEGRRIAETLFGIDASGQALAGLFRTAVSGSPPAS